MGEVHSHLGQFALSPGILSSQAGLREIAQIAEQAGAGEIFFNSFDEIASDSLRKAAFGLLPPAPMRDRTSGIYFRPRFLQNHFSASHWLKRAGLRRLQRRQFFNRLLLLDDRLIPNARTHFPAGRFTFLPDPYPANFEGDRLAARRNLELEMSRRVFLFYGGPYRRKGMHLAAEAFQQLGAASPALLLYAGQPPEDSNLLMQLRNLEERGAARLLLRRVSDSEERLLFAAADFVLLPYVGHFGSSGVLSRAAGASRPVIASDEELVGHLARQYELGLLFPTGNSAALKQAIATALSSDARTVAKWEENARRFAASCSREAFRTALLESFKA
jgi:glycosyltransferase involved in cell wall biosynthesis